jgi:pimeloyl-ACP methyl ester carboxylesterase
MLMNLHKPWRLFASATFLALFGMTAQAAGNLPTSPIEQHYYAPGPWAMVASPLVVCCDSSGTKMDIYYPSNLGQGGFHHPIVTWGNGTGAVPSQYAYFIQHLVSWGFVVVATENQNTGSGQEMLDGVSYLIAQNASAASQFYNKLNTARVASIGHSQGAFGALNAMIKSNGGVTAAMTIELPGQAVCLLNSALCLNVGSLTKGSVFLINGSTDLISLSTYPGVETAPQSNSDYYAALPGSVAKLWGTLNGPNHNDIQGQPDCQQASTPCTNGVYGYLGYPTAWLMDRLQGDSYAHGAFVWPFGEMMLEKTNWSNQISNIYH